MKLPIKNTLPYAIIVILVIALGVVYSSKTETKQPTVLSGDKVFSFDTLDQAEEFEDLEKFGLQAPESYNHTKGKNLILLAIKATSFFKGDWVMAHGLLGVSMLDVSVEDRIGYESLFLSSAQRFKMFGSFINDDNALLVDFDRQVKPTKSVIATREAYIYSLSDQLNGRYIYNNAGNFGRNYFPERNRDSNVQLENTLVNGLKFYSGLKDKGYDDKTLKDMLGIAYASLDYDGVIISDTNLYTIGALQVYSDALTATLAKLNENSDHSYQFLEELGWEMQSRGLATDDKILLPDDEKNFEAILKIIEEDLNNIKK